MWVAAQPGVAISALHFLTGWAGGPIGKIEADLAARNSGDMVALRQARGECSTLTLHQTDTWHNWIKPTAEIASDDFSQ